MAPKHPKPPTGTQKQTPASTLRSAVQNWNNEGGAPVGGRNPKRPRDLNQRAKHMVDLATMDESERAALKKKTSIKPAKKRVHRPGKRSPSSS
jgi:transposase-like protein